ncbi:MAG: hypothetical protein ACI4WH_03535 [Oscillospiraceae bacterium]
MEYIINLENVVSVCLDDTNKNIYYLFIKDNYLCYLYSYNISTGDLNYINQFSEICTPYIYDIADTDFTESAIEMKSYKNYIGISQQLGLNLIVYNLKTNEKYHFTRKYYHSEHCHFGFEFFTKNNDILLLHQTDWNRLNIFNLTKEIEITENTSNFDYFHSGILKSPNEEHFISNGWHWCPADCIYSFDFEEFLKYFEGCHSNLYNAWTTWYNWDRPCTFINNDTLVIARDKLQDLINDGEEYNQLALYKLENISKTECFKTLDIELFRNYNQTDEYGEIKGKLFYIKSKDSVIALEDDFLRILDLSTLEVEEYILNHAKDFDFSIKFETLYHIEDNTLHIIEF